MMKFSVQELFEGILAGNKRLLAKAITLVESKHQKHQKRAEELLTLVMPHTGNSVRIGITGVPGAGKSTFIESFGKYALLQEKKVAVLAIDPSSTINKGAILGDKTRMEELAKEENAFIRPSPNSGFLGGVANTTFETMLLCEAAGFDYILIETVGVGQSEILVADISDVFLFLKIIDTGDELQGIKRGIMEMVDLVFINKVNEDNLSKAKLTKQDLLRAFHFMPEKEKGWKTPVLMGSALEHQGIEQVYHQIETFINLKKENQTFENIRMIQAEKRFQYWVQEYILQKIKSNHQIKSFFQEHRKKAMELKANPSSEAKIFVNQLLP